MKVGADFVRSAILPAALLVLAGCSGAETSGAAASASPEEIVEEAPTGPVEPDFDTTKNAFYRECMQGQRNVKECTCTTRTLREGVSPETYQLMFDSGMSAVIGFKGETSKSVNAALGKALKDCHRR
jgi:hypothetical protein